MIIYRLEETQEKETDQNERDKTDVLKILATTNPELISEFQTSLLEGKKIIRLGRKEAGATKPRPLKVILRDEDMKSEVLQGCKHLKNSPYEHISIQRDLTIEEQKKNYKLRQLLKQKIAAGENVCIFRGEIIPVEQRPAKTSDSDK